MSPSSWHLTAGFILLAIYLQLSPLLTSLLGLLGGT